MHKYNRLLTQLSIIIVHCKGHGSSSNIFINYMVLLPKNRIHVPTALYVCVHVGHMHFFSTNLMVYLKCAQQKSHIY